MKSAIPTGQLRLSDLSANHRLHRAEKMRHLQKQEGTVFLLSQSKFPGSLFAGLYALPEGRAPEEADRQPEQNHVGNVGTDKRQGIPSNGRIYRVYAAGPGRVGSGSAKTSRQG